jgi:hypothetical protein
MSISYPLTLPTNIGMSSIELRAVNTTAVSVSPFTYKQQTYSYDGERWEADITLPPMNRDDAESWVSFLMGLRGKVGSFLLYDPSAKNIRGTATSVVVSGTTGQSSVSVVMTGTLKAGDYIQLGSASDATLHKVLVDQSGDGTLEIWPKLRKDRSSVTAVIVNSSGVFRLESNETSWSVNNASFFGISFGATEVIL